ncbi:MAG: hypothetical protein K6L75_15895 [Cellvibrionaceae bacterium]
MMKRPDMIRYQCKKNTLFLFFMAVFSFLWQTSYAGLMDEYLLSSHAKYQTQLNRYPENSLYRELIDATTFDQLIDTRWMLSARKNKFDVNVDYQLQVVDGDMLGFSQSSNELLNTNSFFSTNAFVSDDLRVFDLTHVVSNDEDTVLLHRLDRMNVGYSNNNMTVRVGRQVVSWGNGLIYNPLDFFNPFDPAAIDKEYKTGDDMLYAQYLLESGSDVQAVWVARREPKDSILASTLNNKSRGDISSSQQSMAIKYHYVNYDSSSSGSNNFLAGLELDFVLAQHYEDEIVGVGLVKSIGGALWRSDVMVTKTERQRATSFVTNLSYSWVWRGHNVSGIIEYFYNGFGVKKNSISLADLTPVSEDDVIFDLLSKVQRGELYGIGRHYFAASASIELTPLMIASPTLFINLVDSSALFQLTASYDIAQNWQIIGALNVPIGSKDTEFGGMSSDLGVLNNNFTDTTLATDTSLFVQFAFYF